jgi:hypothetical protein
MTIFRRQYDEMNQSNTSQELDHSHTSPQIDHSHISPQIDHSHTSPLIDHSHTSPQIDHSHISPHIDQSYTSSVINVHCVNCDNDGTKMLICKHVICRRCELLKHWFANQQMCDNCDHIDKLKRENTQLRKKLQSIPHVYESVKPTTQASTEAIRKRVDILHTVVKLLSGSRNMDDEVAEWVALLSEYLQRHKCIAVGLKNSHINVIQRRLTAQEDVKIWLQLNMTGNQRNKLVSSLHKLGLNIFAPNYVFEAARKQLQLTAHYLFSYVTLTEGPGRGCLVVSDIKAALTQKITELQSAGKLLELERFGGEVWVQIGGDKGGGTTKLIASIVNAQNSSSVHNLLLIGLYQGTDNAENLRTAFSDFTGQLQQLTTLPVRQEDGSIKDAPVKLFLIGDTMFISHVLGHMTTSALFPCPFCLVPKADLQTVGQLDIEKVYTERTIESYCQSATIITTTRNKSADTHSVSRPPLFHISTKNHCPPLLHIILGTGTALYKSLEEMCIKRDQENVGIFDNKKSKASLAEKIELVNCANSELIELRRIAPQQLTLNKTFLNVHKITHKPTKPCDGIICLNKSYRTISERSNELITCDYCAKWFHFACDGIVTLVEISDATKNGYKCAQCQGFRNITDLINITNMKNQWTKEKIIAKQDELTQLKVDLTQLEEIVLKRNGPCSKRLTNTLKDLKIDLKAYHTGTFVGNHMRKMLTGDGPERLSLALGSDIISRRIRHKYKTVFTDLGKIQGYFESRFLLPEEQLEFQQSCSTFASHMKEYFPHESVTPKMHFLLSHLSTFLHRHNTLGLMSEQALESLHATVNRLERQYGGVHDLERRWRLIAQHLYASSTL